MPEWPDNEMDKLFQEGSEKYDFEYNPEAWQQMGALLDKQDRRRRAFWWIWGGLGMAFLMAAFSYFFFAKKNPEINDHPKKNNPSVLEENPTNLQHEQTKPLPDTDLQENGLGGTIQQEQALPSGPDNGEEQGVRFQQKPRSKKAVPEKATIPSETKTMDPSYRPLAKSGTSEEVTEPKILDPKISGENIVSFENKEENDGLPTTDGKVAPLRVLPDLLPYPAIPFFASNDLPFINLPPQIAFVEEDGTDPKSNKASFLIGLLGASEFNSVGFGDFSEMNWKYGLQPEYRFAKRLAVKSGVNYIHMWYDAGAGEYEPGGYFWVDGIAPESTRGQCNMLEIPLLLSYHFKGHQHNGFFATAGVASYIILEEHYWYRYENPPPDPVRYWGTQKDEQDWLNIGHISGGYNFNFSKKCSLQVGPYLQFPLTGVGHGKVKIYSLGLNAVVNFKVK